MVMPVSSLCRAYMARDLVSKSFARVSAACPLTSQYEDARSVITRGKITITYSNQTSTQKTQAFHKPYNSNAAFHLEVCTPGRTQNSSGSLLSTLVSSVTWVYSAHWNMYTSCEQTIELFKWHHDRIWDTHWYHASNVTTWYRPHARKWQCPFKLIHNNASSCIK